MRFASLKFNCAVTSHRVDCIANDFVKSCVHRCFDMLLSMVVLVLASPTVIGTEVAIRIDGTLSVFVKQTGPNRSKRKAISRSQVS